ncbi:hypothetical protein EDB85DRAFT_173309 [Lactarius pseudohatsudake]|nr:hypothetical protein EDB85DRAFT_173309 [Lactarius pseudohatsudake]
MSGMPRPKGLHKLRKSRTPQFPRCYCIDMTGQPEGQPKRHFPPLYKSSGDSSSDRLAFFHILERLKTQKRTGWVDNKVHRIL